MATGIKWDNVSSNLEPSSSGIVEAGKLWESSFSNLSGIAKSYSDKTKKKNTAIALAEINNIRDPNQLASAVSKYADSFDEDTLDFTALQKGVEGVTAKRQQEEEQMLNLFNTQSNLDTARLNRDNISAEMLRKEQSFPTEIELLEEQIAAAQAQREWNMQQKADAAELQKIRIQEANAKLAAAENKGNTNLDIEKRAIQNAFAAARAIPGNEDLTYLQFGRTLSNQDTFSSNAVASWVKDMDQSNIIDREIGKAVAERVANEPTVEVRRERVGQNASDAFPETNLTGNWFLDTSSPEVARDSAEKAYDRLISEGYSPAAAERMVKAAWNAVLIDQASRVFADRHQWDQDRFNLQINKLIENTTPDSPTGGKTGTAPTQVASETPSVGSSAASTTPSSSRVAPTAVTPPVKPSEAAGMDIFQNLRAKLAEAQMIAESNGKEDAVSKAGAIGLMQVLPTTAMNPGNGVPNIFKLAKQLGSSVNTEDEATAEALLKDPKINLAFGNAYMDAMLDRFGNMQDALIAYNWGPSKAAKWIKGGRKAPLPNETADYLAKILKATGSNNTDTFNSFLPNSTEIK